MTTSLHRCGLSATNITDPEAFAVCLARGVEHPDFQAHLQQPRYPGARVPGPIEIPITSLLGEVGPDYCAGSRLDPVDGSLEKAMANRLAWALADRAGRAPGVPEPTATRLTRADFEDACMIFTFAPQDAPGWEPGTVWRPWQVFPDPDSHAVPVLPRRFWQDDPDAPFGALLDIVETYCHPEAYDAAYGDLKRVVRRPDRDPVFDRFKQQLAAAIRDPSRVPDGALLRAAMYDDGSAPLFLARLWDGLYPGEPLPGCAERA